MTDYRWTEKVQTKAIQSAVSIPTTAITTSST